MTTLKLTPTPFTKLLVANRGEIAMRVIRTAKAMGYATVAVHSNADASALHVLAADESVAIGDSAPAQSYLRIDRIIDAARRTGADAIHPGYGFLAENEDFAQACADAGIVFVGPSAKAIRAMGHKALAKQLMMDAGVPCVAGYQGEDQSDARLLAEAQRVGYPVMIKATAGGGGRGMRLVGCAEDFIDLLKSAKSEAKSAFGDDDVLLERAIVEPRHIEIQVVADRHGHAILLGERDCSVQRRHQKVIEESPSPAVDADLRDRMGAAAVKAVKAIAYEGAGTLEFLLDRDGNFYFMEMNTRLQVEHPVTEAVTGLDLVELQLRVASGEPLPLTQAQVQFNGHAIEVRLCAEDPKAGFMPQSGHMGLWRESTLVRVEHGLNRHADISPYYDSMVAKLIAHGRDRDEARRRLLHGLADTVALGVATNQAFLAACLRHPVFAAGGATTAFIAQHQTELLAADLAQQREAFALAAAVFYAVDDEAIPHAFEVPLRLTLDGVLGTAVMTHEAGEGCTVQIGEHRYELRLHEVAEHDVRFTCNGVGRKAVFCRDGSTLDLHGFGRPWHIVDLTREPVLKHAKAGGDGKLRASMNGRVVAIAVAVGDSVVSGQAMVTLEAMKMEHIHAAPIAGTVKAIHVSLGEQVGAHRVVAEVEPT
jgi:geranyl-CoA carboxylase alpha subunit